MSGQGRGGSGVATTHLQLGPRKKYALTALPQYPLHMRLGGPGVSLSSMKNFASTGT